MTVSELIEMLQNKDPDAEVRFMSQYNWPFEYSVSERIYSPAPTPTESICAECVHGVTLTDDEWHHDDETLDTDHEPTVETDDEADWQPSDAPEAGVVFLVEGTQLGYGTKAAWS